MKVEPQYEPVGKFFEYKPMYRVPTYQRAYAWGKMEIDDFLRDLENCYKKRRLTNPISHFFGQIVTIKTLVEGTEKQEQFDLVDGQQRLATFILLIAALVQLYKEIITEIESDITKNNEKGILSERVNDLTARYIEFRQEVAQVIQTVEVLCLSRRDENYFTSFIKSPNENPEENSHKLIHQAFSLIKKKIYTLTNSSNLGDKLTNLRTVELVLEKDFVVMNMVVTEVASKKEAFTLFQVLNNRGRNLTEGDLLRAETLRLLDGNPTEQNEVEEFWNEILKDEPYHTEKFLRCIFGSYSGKEPGTNSLFIEFLDQFVSQHSLEHIRTSNARDIHDQMKLLKKDMLLMRRLHKGEWPFEIRQPIQRWDRNRLFLLMGPLNHQMCLPLLLSATLLDHRRFNRIVQMLERFIFRYLIIGKQYAGDLIKIYHEEAKIIRNDPARYDLNGLRQKLVALELKVDDQKFVNGLPQLEYTRDGSSNSALKYFLLSLEYYLRWYTEGAEGTAICHDRERVYDFRDSTIEHIYPYSAKEGEIDPELEPLKNTMGNLTILGHDDNRAGENDSFEDKKAIYRESSLQMNRDNIAPKLNWTKAVVDQRNEEMKEMACVIFKI